MTLPVGLWGKLMLITTSVWANGVAHTIEVEFPVLARIERDTSGVANAERHGLDGLVVGDDDDGMVVGTEKGVHGGEDSFLRADEGEHLVRGDRVVGGSDGFAESGRAPGFRVAEIEAVPGGTVGGVGQGQKLGEGHGLHVGGAEVVSGGEFPFAEEDLERKRAQRVHWVSPAFLWSWSRIIARREGPRLAGEGLQSTVESQQSEDAETDPPVETDNAETLRTPRSERRHPAQISRPESHGQFSIDKC